MISGIHHLGMLVTDYERTVEFYGEVLGGELVEEVSVDGKVEVAIVEVPEGKLELIARNERGTYLDDLLDELREHSQYHVAYTVSDIEVALEALGERGFELYNPEPVEGVGNYVRAFVAPGAVPGIPIELVELRDDT